MPATVDDLSNVTHGQAGLAHLRAAELCDTIYRASLQNDGSEAFEANVAHARNLTARIAELLGCHDVAEQIRKAA